MKTTFFLTVNSNGTVKTTKNRPNLNWNEIAIQMNLTLPNQLFEKPQLQATIVIPENAAAPKEVDVATADNIREAIEEAVGMEVRLTIENPVE